MFLQVAYAQSPPLREKPSNLIGTCDFKVSKNAFVYNIAYIEDLTKIEVTVLKENGGTELFIFDLMEK